MKRRLKIDMNDLALAFDSGSYEMRYYLDTTTGDVPLVTEDDQHVVEEFFESEESNEDEGREERFQPWLQDCGCPGWQVDSIRQAFLIETDSENRYVQVPGQDSREGFRDMEDFVETVSNKHLRDMLEFALGGPKPFRRFKDALGRDDDETDRWYKFSEERQKSRMLEWLDSIDIELA